VPTTLGDGLAGRDNALNFLRLVLASAVVVGHTWPIGGFGMSSFQAMADIAVDGFFALSGYLIAGARTRSTMSQFLVRRMLRILPGFWVCLLVTAFVLAPISVLLSDGAFVFDSAADYVTHNFALTIHQWGIEHTLQESPFPGAWDGSLWTLEIEFAAYLMAGTLLSSRWVRERVTLVTSLLLLTLATVAPLAHGPLHVTTSLYLDVLRLSGFFLAGMLVWSLRAFLRPGTGLVAASAATVVVLSVLMDGAWRDIALSLPLTFLLLALGARLPVRLGAANDVSYGMYVYAFPVQQLLAVAGASALGFVGFASLSLALTLPLAWASWRYVERPAVGLARRLAPAPIRTGRLVGAA
jgi:peptidoglycan/LPS O-acetylase OafA/YrhL